MAPIKEGAGNVPPQALVKWNDPDGNPLVSINRDGTVTTQGVTYSDGTKQITASSGGSGTPAGINTDIQYNASGVFGGSGGLFTFTPTTEEVFLDNAVSGAGAGPALAIGTPLASPLSAGGIMLTGSTIGVGTQFSGVLEIHNPYSNGVSIFTHSSTSFRAPITQYYKSRGTQTVPTAVLNADILAYPNQIFAFDGSVYGPGCTLEPRATENWNSTSHGCAWDFFVVENTTTNQFRAVQIDNTGNVGIGYNTIGPPALLSVGPTAQFQVNTTGQATTTAIFLSDFGSAPTSAGTAGTIGEIVTHGGLLYFCSATGAAGAASWNKLTMTLV